MPEVFKTEVCNGLDPTMVAKVLADCGMLLRAEDQYQRTHRIQGKVLRLYTITTVIFSGSDNETPVTPVTSVTGPETGGFLHSDLERVTGEKSNKTGDITVVTGVTGEKHKDEEKHVCVQCGAGGDLALHLPDGKDPTWLHEECVHFWKADNDTGLDLPGFLDRRAQKGE